MNKIILIGHVGQDAELRDVGSTTVLSFSVATTEKWKDKNGERQERTDWHSVSLWGKRGEALAKYVTKGTRVAVEGRVQYRQYEDRDGNKRTATEIVASDIELLGGGSRQSDGPRYQGSGYSGDFNDDDVPF